MVRIVHFSDTHLGHQQYARTDPDTGINQREQDHYDAFDKVIQHALTTKPDAVIHAGDLFDGVRPSNRALAHALEGFLRLSRAGIPTVIIAGNHEHPKMRETGSAFRLLEHLDHIHPVYRARAETVELRDGLRIHAVPQCLDNDALRAEAEAIDAPDDGHDVLVMHGAVHSLDAFKHAEFNELSLDPRWFDDRFDYVALGHFHSKAKVRSHAWYCGAPDRVSVAEAGEQKGFLEVTFDGDGRPDVHFQVLEGRAYVDLPALQGSNMDSGEILTAAAKALGRVPSGAVARLRLMDLDASLRGVLDLRAIRDAARQALHLDLRVEWQAADPVHLHSTELRGLQAEFDAFAAQHDAAGLDQDRLVRMARQVLLQAGAA